MTKVVLKPGESQESPLRRFRKQVTRDRILSDVKKKPSSFPRARSGDVLVSRPYAGSGNASGENKDAIAGKA